MLNLQPAEPDGARLWECASRPPWRMAVRALPGGFGGHNDNGVLDDGTSIWVDTPKKLWCDRSMCDVMWHDIAVVASVGIF